MLTRELIKKIRRIEIITARQAQNQLVGAYQSVFKGMGMAFSEVRPYQPGDDVRRIDWNVTARLRKPYIKRHIEERELVVLLLVDVSASGHFGTVDGAEAQAGTKRELAAVLAGALAFSAVREGDRVGVVTFTDRVGRYVPPRKTRSHVTRLLHELLFSEIKSRGTSLTAPLNFLNNLFHRPALVFVISDFHDADEAKWTQALKATNQRHEVVALRLLDPRETELPDVGVVMVQDAETGEVRELDTGDPRIRAAYAQAAADRSGKFRSVCRLGGIPDLTVRMDEVWPQRLQRFLDMAARRRVA